jgi:crossover junction endodeoxyribonuclease RuvC
MGIDPGSQKTGLAVIQASCLGGGLRKAFPWEVRVCGVLQLQGDFLQRLKNLGRGIEDLLEREKPQAVAVEKIFLGRNPDSAFKLGHARGVILDRVLQKGIPVFEYTPREIKKSVVGSGAADKLQIQDTLSRLFRKDLSGSLDATDALAVACHHGFLMQHPLVKNLAPASGPSVG